MKLIKKFFATIWSLIVAMFSKADTAIKKEYGLDLYKASFEEMRLKHKELNEDLIDIQTEEDFTKSELENLKKNKEDLKKKIIEAKKAKDNVLFTKLAIEFKSIEKKIESSESFIKTIMASREKITNYISNLEIAIKEKEVKLNELTFKNKTSKSMESIQGIIENIGENVNFSDFKEIEDNINKDFIKQNIKSEILDGGEFSKPMSFVEVEDMDAFLLENGITESKETKSVKSKK